MSNQAYIHEEAQLLRLDGLKRAAEVLATVSEWLPGLEISITDVQSMASWVLTGEDPWHNYYLSDRAGRNTDGSNRWPDDSMLEAAWGIIANAWHGDWQQASPEWREAAENWRDAYHHVLDVTGETRESTDVDTSTTEPIEHSGR